MSRPFDSLFFPRQAETRMEMPISKKDDADSAEERWKQIARLHLKPKYHDMMITCGGEKFHAHRSVVCMQSEYFENADNFAEAQGGPKDFELPGHAITLIRSTLEYLYTGDYTTKRPLVSEETDIVTGTAVSLDQTCFHAQMYAKGVYLIIPGLQEKARKKFKASFMSQLHNSRLTTNQFCNNKLSNKSFAAIIGEVYATESPVRGLKDLLVELTMENVNVLWSGDNPIFDQNILESAPDFTLDLCTAQVRENVHRNEIEHLNPKSGTKRSK